MSITQEHHGELFDQGFRAYEGGDSRLDNPYYGYSHAFEEYLVWRQGWMCGRDEYVAEQGLDKANQSW
ncbi:hypothetical protein CMI37_15605 [Candidatus Pacearchaeota archaeon]|nr:hypothetical protein [Candidatus Pacearchaeota archaeon]